MMSNWIKFSSINEKTNNIYVPPQIAEKVKPDTILHFGLRQINVNCLSDSGLVQQGEFDNPFIIKCDKSILDELMVVDTLTYQLLIKEDEIHIGPVIGFLMGEQYYYYHDRYLKDLKDAMGIYKEVGGLFISFKTSGIKWDEGCLYGLYYELQENKWKYGKLPLPSVVFRRSFHREDKDIETLKNMIDGKMFNTIKLDKLEVHERLKKDKSFAKYLPNTEKLESIRTFNDFITANPKVILKPKGLSRGRGICIVERTDKNYFDIHDYRNYKSNYKIQKSQMLKFLITNKFLSGDYLIQQYLTLAHIDGDIFDIRVVMQKNPKFEWQCTGIEFRVASKGYNLTNISVGGKALAIKDAVKMAYKGKFNPKDVEKDLVDISKEFCLIMDKNEGYYAEYGLDLVMDVNGKYWFIEGNFRPAFKGFQLIDYNIYYEICYATVRYAVALAGFENRGGEK